MEQVIQVGLVAQLIRTISVQYQRSNNPKNRLLIIRVLLKRVKKKRNQHLNQQIEVNGENFEFERDQIEKKAPSHGTDFGLDPDYSPDGEIIRDRKTGKPRAKQNKENYEKFTANLSEFVQDPTSEKIEPQYRKGRDNEQDAVGFLNRKDRRFVIFDRHTKKYITGWVMNDLQYQEFINNNNII